MMIRIYQDLDPKEIKKELIIIDDLYGICSNCNHLGLNYQKDKVCPKCKVEFKYIATRNKVRGDAAPSDILKRIKEMRPDLIIVDYNDYQYSNSKKEALNIFKS